MNWKRIFSVILDVLIAGLVIAWGYLLYADFQVLAAVPDPASRYAVFNVKALLFALFLIVSFTSVFYLHMMGSGKRGGTPVQSRGETGIDEGLLREIALGLKEMRQKQTAAEGTGGKVEPSFDKDRNKVYIPADSERQYMAGIDFLSKIVAVSSLKELVSFMIDVSASVLRSKRVSIFLYNREKKKLVLVKGTGIIQGHDRNGKPAIETDEGMAWNVFRNGKRMFVTNIETHPELARENWPQYAKKSFMIFPIKLFNSESIGVINFTEKTENQGIFTMDDLELMNLLISLFSIKLENLILTDSINELVKK